MQTGDKSRQESGLALRVFPRLPLAHPIYPPSPRQYLLLQPDNTLSVSVQKAITIHFEMFITSRLSNKIQGLSVN